MRSTHLILLASLVAGTVAAQDDQSTNPQMTVEVSIGHGSHTLATPKDTFFDQRASMYRLGAAFRVGDQRKLNAMLILESSISGTDNAPPPTTCVVGHCPQVFPTPGGIGLGLEGRGISWSRLALAGGGGIGLYHKVSSYVESNAGLRVYSNWSLLVDVRRLWSKSENDQPTVFTPISFGIRYGHNGEG